MAKYIDADLLRKDLEKYYDEYRLKFNTEGDPYYLGVADGLDVAKRVIDPLQQEQPSEDLKGEIREWVNLMVGASFPEQDGDYISEEDYRSVIRQTALHFYKLGKQGKEPVNEDLEEAAENYAEKHGFRVPYDGSEKFYDETDVKASKDGFIAGAEWQEKQTLKGDRLTELDKSYKQAKRELEWFNEGKRQEREQILKEAVEGEIVNLVPERNYVKVEREAIAKAVSVFKEGDKVKIVIIPDKEE